MYIIYIFAIQNPTKIITSPSSLTSGIACDKGAVTSLMNFVWFDARNLNRCKVDYNLNINQKWIDDCMAIRTGVFWSPLIHNMNSVWTGCKTRMKPSLDYYLSSCKPFLDYYLSCYRKKKKKKNNWQFHMRASQYQWTYSFRMNSMKPNYLS